MKKLMIAAIAVVGFSVTGLAQQQVKFGPKAGVNLATISGNDDSEMKIGFHVGAVAEIKFNDKFSLQPEVLYSAQGGQLKENSDIKMNNDYINIPIMAKYYFVEGFSVELGPQVGFLMKSELKGNDGSVDTKDAHKSIDFGVGVGLAYDLPMGLFVNARYNIGLSKINEDIEAGPITVETDDVKNSVIQIGIGYKFD
ncbi:MAG TPA: porin family protein [Flavobacterium sp.]|nr:porin family protein [Flavobacterium sp.]